ncbi:hypothetical protein HFU84_03870 [Acidithiobacillus sp. CV18-2]|uniref:Uncharacterized protein n=1 Tax=Igneacidithiobacillus copahuensis TaxID=2724909 RepID=A0AAE3CKP5_9PROT|nr:hypothetical protein [Igneacidithiobacillus copahuensis]MBU2755033.1 hypothetical protein [Acidithiobacillus sp. CV18-3]MBU2757975.1 hypothetical protein [Acidithiobacillus sp. BN09-2]MBU2776652.1 hypothetical protein [Acidithiobacillus sp. CV18-2]MBU2796144.1 hypothetical protein [Acidithiobacillus sp. VAN18-2]MBU2798663.1 hypothetical protein [Acidithiobacillus sp. VAN18-4]UTV82390.1 hypothetical protein MQE22_05365 [Acidithiobacillus sp. YTS05]
MPLPVYDIQNCGAGEPKERKSFFAGVIFVDGIPASETQLDPQQDAA